MLTPGEVMQLPADESVVMVSGHAPIKAKKLRYYTDANFKQRVLPPPMLADGGYSDVPPARRDDWSGLAIPTVLATAATDGVGSADDGGPRQQPELSDVGTYSPEPEYPVSDLSLLDDDDVPPLFPSQLDPTLQRTARLARLKEAEKAAAASVFFRTGTQTAAPVAQSQVEAASGFAANAAFDPLAAGPASTAAQPVYPTAVQNRQDQKETFLAGGSTQTRNSGNLQMPVSPYQVMAGTVIAGALVTGIKSDLPGDVIATVTEPVYDTATGKFQLIPQGSRILGKYNSQVSYGQSRVQVM